MENQYFTSPLIAEALAARLRDADGPEVVLISTEHSPSWFDRATMDKTRFNFIGHLQAADAHGRFRAYSPVTALGRVIIVHAKLTVIDDALLRIGSANINNRSMGFDSECDLCLETRGEEQEARLAELRLQLVAHWLGCPPQDVAETLHTVDGRLTAALDALRSRGLVRLRPIIPGPMGPVASLVARGHVGDPVASADAWRPWRRRAARAGRLAAAGLDTAQARLTR